MKTIYCISGLGADERVFKYLDIPGYEIHFINWVEPERNEDISAYAFRLTSQINDKVPILLGLSFGGMMAIEISKLIPVSLIILISSIKSMNELPRWLKIAGRLNLDRILPLRTTKLSEPLQNYNLGVESPEEKQLAHEYRKTANRKYINWAVNRIVNWKNCNCDAPLYHIHGAKDRIFKIKNIKPNHVIADGGHLMIMNRAAEINSKITEILNEF